MPPARRGPLPSPRRAITRRPVQSPNAGAPRTPQRQQLNQIRVSPSRKLFPPPNTSPSNIFDSQQTVGRSQESQRVLPRAEAEGASQRAAGRGNATDTRGIGARARTDQDDDDYGYDGEINRDNEDREIEDEPHGRRTIILDVCSFPCIWLWFYFISDEL